MIEQMDELYREVILEHFKHSPHAGEIADAQIKAEGSNPLCGDDLTVYLKLDGDRVTQARFAGKGCAISQAAASMLMAQLEGKTRQEIMALIAALKEMMQGQENGTVDIGDLEALAGVRKFPVRIKCAALSWNVVEDGFEAHNG